MSLNQFFLSIFGLASLLTTCVVGQDAGEAAHVVVVVNTNDSGSAEIAEYYTEQRGIPKDNIIALKMPNQETVTLREFVDTIYNPLLNALIEKGWMNAVKATGLDVVGRERVSVATHHISYLVTTRGVPLRIANDATLLGPGLEELPEQFKVNNGSVDGELALLAGPANLSMAAFVPNPLFSNMTATSVDAKRVIRVSRLDGPSVAVVKKLIARSMQAEAEGLLGRAYFDIGGPHAKGDEWMTAAGDLAVEAYYDTDFEKTKRPMDSTDRYDAPAIYMGWYRQNAYGSWGEPKWAVPPGAIGFHLHSFSATTVRSTSTGWLGAFVNQGYCATVGNVYEPYLEYTHHPHMLLAALLEGHTFGEAAMFSNPALSWQGVAIGDPLYRPFKLGLDAQLKVSMENPLSAYLCLRQINRLEAEGQSGEALTFARTQFVRQPSLPLAYKLAKLYAARGETKKALEALKVARYITVFSTDEVVLVKQIADFLNKHGDGQLALDLYQKLIDQPSLEKSLRLSLLEDGAKVAIAEGAIGLSSSWRLSARK
ncbi:MAG: hypothetical protein ABS34_06485 [Opitutaceae bacterium BACL24 MAG-120322-bin51]|jgi:uncharacterized protein (TIGR03790 family)|nr:MAG: hypothetical protein ABS34_06485 [Opitutaceae bacterium BACL24 MAG-120322-bin51]